MRQLDKERARYATEETVPDSLCKPASLGSAPHQILRLTSYSETEACYPEPRVRRQMKLVLFVLFSFAGSLWAQSATLQGVVTDESGAVIPKANVTLKGPDGL